MARSRATASRLSRNARGIGTPLIRRSRSLVWLCSPGSQMRSTPGSRGEARISRITWSTARLNSAGGMKASTDKAAIAWPVLVGLPASLTKSSNVAAKRRAVECAGKDPDDEAQT